MNIGGWVVMIVSVFGMTGLLIWCVARVISQPQAAEKLNTQINIDTRDHEG